jgi:hypothetical protein
MRSNGGSGASIRNLLHGGAWVCTTLVHSEEALKKQGWKFPVQGTA